MTLLTPRKQPAQARSRATVAAILEGAAQVLERQGIGDFTTNAIASQAGVSIGTLYQYYPDKNAVAAALSRQVRSGLLGRVARAVDAAREASLEEGARAIIAAALEDDALRPRLARALDMLEAHLPLQAEGGAIDSLLSGQVARFLKIHFADVADDVLEDMADDVRAITGALADAAGRRASSLDGDLVERIARSSLAVIEAHLTSLDLKGSRVARPPLW